MHATMSDLTEPIQSVLDRIPVQEMLEKVPPDVREHLPERFRPEERSHRRLWMTILVLVGVGAIVVLAKRRSSHDEDISGLDLRDSDMPGGVSVMDRAETAGMPFP